MPHRSRPRRSIPAAALGDFSPIDPRPGGTFAAGRIPPPEMQFDFSIMDAPRPSPLQLPSPKRRDAPWRSKTHLPTIPQIAESLFGESSSSSSSTSSTSTTGTVPTPYTASDLLQLSTPTPVHLQPRDAANRLPTRDPASISHENAHRDSQPSKLESNLTATDPRNKYRSAKYCIFQRKDCTDTVLPNYVCWDCGARIERQTQRREKILRKILLLGWLALQAVVVVLLTYTVMAAKHTRAMRQIVDQFDQMC